MTPEQLALKQLEMQERSRKRRARQNGKNARGPRKQGDDLKLRGTRRGIEDLIRDVIAAALPGAPLRYICYLVYAADCRERNEPVKTMKEFYEYLPEEKDDGAPGIQIREPEMSRSGQDERIEREAISLP